MSVAPAGLVFHHPDGTDVAVRVLSARAFPEVWPGWRGNALIGDFYQRFPATRRAGPDRAHRDDGRGGRRGARVPQIRSCDPAGGHGHRALPARTSREGPGLALRDRSAQGRRVPGAGLHTPSQSTRPWMRSTRPSRRCAPSTTARAGGWERSATPTCPGWLACLPMSPAGGLDADLARMGRMKTLLTSSAVNLAPVHGEWRGQRAADGRAACIVAAREDADSPPPGLLSRTRRGTTTWP